MEVPAGTKHAQFSKHQMVVLSLREEPHPLVPETVIFILSKPMLVAIPCGQVHTVEWIMMTASG